jgi:beta-glucanase (GH16 family)
MNPLIRLTLLGVFAGCTPENVDLSGERWELVWEDDFRGEAGSPPDAATWTYDIGRGDNGWGNSELQHYTDRPENVSLDGDGFLRIVARREAFEGAEWTSARIKTQGLKTFTYGRLEARILLPAGRGLWPAFWMLGADIETLGWPTCGEIDIMEAKGRLPDESSGAIHGPGYSGGGALGGTYDFPEGESITDFHVYRVDWDPEHITWYVDDNLVFTAHPGMVRGAWVLDHEFFLILNVAVGGIFDGPPDEATPDSNLMAIDWVRYYERRLPIPDPDVVVP